MQVKTPSVRKAQSNSVYFTIIYLAISYKSGYRSELGFIGACYIQILLLISMNCKSFHDFCILCNAYKKYNIWFYILKAMFLSLLLLVLCMIVSGLFVEVGGTGDKDNHFDLNTSIFQYKKSSKTQEILMICQPSSFFTLMTLSSNSSKSHFNYRKKILSSILCVCYTYNNWTCNAIRTAWALYP